MKILKTCIKIYGPPLVKAIKALEEAAIDNPKVCISDIFLVTASNPIAYFPYVPKERCGTLISKEKGTLGKFDFFFEWFKEPTREEYEKLLSEVDEVLAPLGCKYSVTTE